MEKRETGVLVAAGTMLRLAEEVYLDSSRSSRSNSNSNSSSRSSRSDHSSIIIKPTQTSLQQRAPRRSSFPSGGSPPPPQGAIRTVTAPLGGGALGARGGTSEGAQGGGAGAPRSSGRLRMSSRLNRAPPPQKKTPGLGMRVWGLGLHAAMSLADDDQQPCPAI